MGFFQLVGGLSCICAGKHTKEDETITFHVRWHEIVFELERHFCTKCTMHQMHHSQCTKFAIFTLTECGAVSHHFRLFIEELRQITCTSSFLLYQSRPSIHKFKKIMPPPPSSPAMWFYNSDKVFWQAHEAHFSKCWKKYHSMWSIKHSVKTDLEQTPVCAAAQWLFSFNLTSFYVFLESHDKV